MNSAYNASCASPYLAIDRDSARALIYAINYRPSDDEYAELEREAEARKAAKAARKADKARAKELKKLNKLSKLGNRAEAAASDRSSILSCSSLRSSMGSFWGSRRGSEESEHR